jgi:hypothetical protein
VISARTAATGTFDWLIPIPPQSPLRLAHRYARVIGSIRWDTMRGQ